MTTIRGLKTIMSGLAPYLLVELLLPGGTLLALLMYLSRRGLFAGSRAAGNKRRPFGFNRCRAAFKFGAANAGSEMRQRDQTATRDVPTARAA